MTLGQFGAWGLGRLEASAFALCTTGSSCQVGRPTTPRKPTGSRVACHPTRITTTKSGYTALFQGLEIERFGQRGNISSHKGKREIFGQTILQPMLKRMCATTELRVHADLISLYVSFSPSTSSLSPGFVMPFRFLWLYHPSVMAPPFTCVSKSPASSEPP